MLRNSLMTGLATALMLGIGAGITPAQSIAPVYDQDDYDRAQVDRYLDVEVWTSSSDGEFYEGDNIVIYFRASRDAFVALYSIDTRGRVNLLFPTFFGEDNFVNGGVTYSLPGGKENYDLVVSGPEGFENIQVVASRERFPIPNWYQGPELVVNDGEDRDDYMDWVNANYFVDYGGQRFAYDRAVIYVNEWEETYYRPIYYPTYPSWTIYGNCYIDYPWGGSVYINGIYWGCVPLYIPRIAVGWHTITVYDHWGYCWEHDFHVSHYNTVVFNHTIIRTSPSVKSKYKEVREVGYRDPVRNGYPDYNDRRKLSGTSSHTDGLARTKGGVAGKSDVAGDDAIVDLPKKYQRGSSKVVKTDRGYETDASTAVFPENRGKVGSTNRSRDTRTYESTKGESGSSGSSGAYERRSGKSRGPSGSGTVGGSSDKNRSSSGSSGSSGSSPRIERRKSSGKTESVTVPKQPPSSGSSGKGESKPTETVKQKKSDPPPAPSQPTTKQKSSDGGSSSSSAKQSSGGGQKSSSGGGQKSSGGGGKKK